MNNTDIAWTRSTFTALWLGLVLWASARFGWELDVESPTTIVVVGLTGSVVWRFSEMLSKVPYVGYVLFGINKDPGYDQPTPPNPEQTAPPPDAGLGMIETIVLVVVVVLAIFGLVYLLN